MKKGICKLCLEEKALLKKSHIIPDFMYQEMYNDKHKLEVFTNESILESDSRVKYPSSGEYESNILCEGCDRGIIGSYESYASELLYSKNIQQSTHRPYVKHFETYDKVRFSEYSNVNFKKLKLFLLSILWRSSISTRPFFRDIALNEHEETIRRMIYEGNEGNEFDYPVIISRFVGGNSSVEDGRLRRRDWILMPRVSINSELKKFWFPINGMIFQFFLVVNDERRSDVKWPFPSSDNKVIIFENPIEEMEHFVLKYTNLLSSSKL